LAGWKPRKEGTGGAVNNRTRGGDLGGEKPTWRRPRSVHYPARRKAVGGSRRCGGVKQREGTEKKNHTADKKETL